MKRIALIVAALMVGGSAFAQTGSTSDPDMTMTTATADAEVNARTGVGGPYQSAATRTAMNAPSAKGGYPACDPGPGDDMCIQLYEAGVSRPTNLAMNEELAGGESTMMASADTTTWNNEVTADTTAAVGGPYEPVTSDTGSPTEASDVAGTDYPACDPGPGDDNCIQPYERSVTADIE